MKTKVLKIDSQFPEVSDIDKAAQALQAGQLVAFPTETVYGLGANALDSAAVKKIFTAKGRPAHDPLIVHISDLSMLEQIVSQVSEGGTAVGQTFLAGAADPDHAQASQYPQVKLQPGLESVAVRMPSHPVALALIHRAGIPVAAPSANRFGHTSPTSAAHVLADLDGRIEMLLDGGSTPIGVESTVLDVTQSPARILRPGGVTYEALQESLGTVLLNGQKTSEEEDHPQISPGLLSRHYAPKAVLILYESEGDQQVCAEMRQKVELLLSQGKRVGCCARWKTCPFLTGWKQSCGCWDRWTGWKISPAVYTWNCARWMKPGWILL